MAVAQSFFNTVMGTILSWTYTICIILAIIKFIQMILAVAGISGGSGSWNPFTSGNGGNGSGGGGSGGGGGNGGDSQDDFEEAEENPTRVRIFVANKEGEPVSNAEVEIWNVKQGMIHAMGNWINRDWGSKSRYYSGETDKDGMWPQGGDYITMPSFTIKIRVTYELDTEELYKKQEGPVRDSEDVLERWGNVFGSEEEVEAERTEDLTPNSQRTFKITLPFHSERSRAFEPFIKNVEYRDGTLYTTGVIRSFAND